MESRVQRKKSNIHKMTQKCYSSCAKSLQLSLMTSGLCVVCVYYMCVSVWCMCVCTCVYGYQPPISDFAFWALFTLFLCFLLIFFGFILLYYFMYVNVLPACIYGFLLYICCLWRSQGCQIPGSEVSNGCELWYWF